MMEQGTKEMKNRVRGLMTLILALLMMFGNSLTVLAATTYTVKYDEADGTWSRTFEIAAGDTLELYSEYGGSGSVTVNGESIGDLQKTGSDPYTIFAYSVSEKYNVTVSKEIGTYGKCGLHASLTSISEDDVNSQPNSGGAKEQEPKKSQEQEEPKESEGQIYTRELLARVAAGQPGDNIVVDATLWHSFSGNLLEELLSKEGVNYTLYYDYQGETFYITIPAGAVLEEGCEWYGPLKLNAMFGRTMIDKSELYAAINQ